MTRTECCASIWPFMDRSGPSRAPQVGWQRAYHFFSVLLFFGSTSDSGADSWGAGLVGEGIRRAPEASSPPAIRMARIARQESEEEAAHPRRCSALRASAPSAPPKSPSPPAQGGAPRPRSILRAGAKSARRRCSGKRARSGTAHPRNENFSRKDREARKDVVPALPSRDVVSSFFARR
jgi:hypothetical protein